MSHEKYVSCIKACFECSTECKHCANACLDEKDVAKLTKCIKLNEDCAAMCLFAAEIMSSGSDFSHRICTICAEMCEACAAECEKHSHMAHCKKCAEVCRDCAEECREMSEMQIL